LTQLVFGQDEAVLQWALAREPDGLTLRGATWAIGMVDRYNNPVGAISILQVSPGGVEIGVESIGGITRQAIRDTFAFVFLHLGASRCEIVTKRTNKRITKHAPNLFGFRFEGVRRDWYGPGQDGLAFYMTPQTCKWIEHDELRSPKAA